MNIGSTPVQSVISTLLKNLANLSEVPYLCCAKVNVPHSWEVLPVVYEKLTGAPFNIY